jgi:hypothetical protein
MNGPHEPDRPRAACREAGRRRSVSQRQTSRQRRQPRDACPQRRRLLDPDHEAFVEWFVAYWRGHGAQLFTDQATEKENHEPNV